MQSCLTLIPKPPKKDFIKLLENDKNVLRFEAVMVSSYAMNPCPCARLFREV